MTALDDFGFRLEDAGAGDIAALAARERWLYEANDPRRRGKQMPPEGDWRQLIFKAGRGFGKDLSLETPIPTPQGWTTMGQVQVGDAVFDEAGRRCQVTFVSDVMHNACYAVRFSDGSSLIAGADHQWVTWTHAERKAFLRSPYEDISRFPAEWPAWRLRRAIAKPPRVSEVLVEHALALAEQGWRRRDIYQLFGETQSVLRRHLVAKRFLGRDIKVFPDSPGPQVRTTREIAATLTYGVRRDTNHCIPHALPLDLPEQVLPIPPYSLGLWLGDGTSESASITAHQDDMGFLRAQIQADCFATSTRADPQQFGILGLATHLRQAGLLNNKHIPPQYLRASVAQRLALLRGLMDSDGGVDNAASGGGNWCTFTNTNKRLADGVYELLMTLGQRGYRDDRIPVCQTGPGARAYRIGFAPLVQVFTLPRKVKALRLESANLRRHHRMIVAVDPVPTVPTRCISVDSRHALYLAGEAMIPTHNTSALVNWQWWECWRLPEIIGHVVAPTLSDVDGTVFEGPAGFRTVVPAECLRGGSWERAFVKNHHTLTLANRSIIRGFGATDAGARLRGPQCHNLTGDELREWDKPPGNLEFVHTNAMFGLRLPYPDKSPARAVFATTPKNIPYLKNLYRQPGVRVVTGTTYENLHNLSSAYRDTVLAKEGTQIGRVEIHAEDIGEEEGGIFKRSWFRLWPAGKKLPEFAFVLMSCDTAFEEEAWDRKKQTADYSCCGIFGVFNTKQCFTDAELKRMGVKNKYAAVLCEFWMERLGFPELLEKARSTYLTKWGSPGRKPDLVLIENKASGISLRQSLIKYGVPTWPYDPKRQSKTMRAHAASPYVLQGCIFVPESGLTERKGMVRDWAEPLMQQLCSFAGEGTTEHDDAVDVLTQSVLHLAERGTFEVAPQQRAMPDPDEKDEADQRIATAQAARAKRAGYSPYGS